MKRRDIDKCATDILRDHGLLQIPVDPLKVAKVLGIRVMNAVFSEPRKSGAVTKRADKFTIYVDTNDSPSRKRFTIAHEIGHRLLHMCDAQDGEFSDTQDNFRTAEEPYDDTWGLERTREWEANTFAAALLMNEDMLRDKWRTCKDPTHLAWMFQVSVTAMVVRLTQLGFLQE